MNMFRNISLKESAMKEKRTTMQNLSIWLPALSIWSLTLSLPSFNLSTKPPTCKTQWFDQQLHYFHGNSPSIFEWTNNAQSWAWKKKRGTYIGFKMSSPHLQRLSRHPSSRQWRRQLRRGWRRLQRGRWGCGTTWFLCNWSPVLLLTSSFHSGLSAGNGGWWSLMARHFPTSLNDPAPPKLSQDILETTPRIRISINTPHWTGF